MQFRQKALAKLQSPEDLAVPMRLADPRGWLVLAVVSVVLAVGAVWAVTGTLPSNLPAIGILTHNEGSYTLQSPYAGQLTSVLIQEGTTFPASTPIASVQTNHGIRVVRAVAAGRAITVLANVGQVVAPGTPLAVVEIIATVGDPLVAVLYVPGVSPPEIPIGAPVDLTVQSVPSQSFGVLRGTVTGVGQFPETQQEISGFLGDSQLGTRFTAAGQPIKVVVALQSDEATASGYRWSTAQGPPYRIDSRLLVSAAIHLTPVRPVSWLVSS